MVTLVIDMGYDNNTYMTKLLVVETWLGGGAGDKAFFVQSCSSLSKSKLIAILTREKLLPLLRGGTYIT